MDNPTLIKPFVQPQVDGASTTSFSSTMDPSNCAIPTTDSGAHGQPSQSLLSLSHATMVSTSEFTLDLSGFALQSLPDSATGQPFYQLDLNFDTICYSSTASLETPNYLYQSAESVASVGMYLSDPSTASLSSLDLSISGDLDLMGATVALLPETEDSTNKPSLESETVVPQVVSGDYQPSQATLLTASVPDTVINSSLQVAVDFPSATGSGIPMRTSGTAEPWLPIDGCPAVDTSSASLRQGLFLASEVSTPMLAFQQQSMQQAVPPPLYSVPGPLCDYAHQRARDSGARIEPSYHPTSILSQPDQEYHPNQTMDSPMSFEEMDGLSDHVELGGHSAPELSPAHVCSPDMVTPSPVYFPPPNLAAPYKRRQMTAYARWTIQEDRQLAEAVQAATHQLQMSSSSSLSSPPLDWFLVASMVPTRSPTQCHARWSKVLAEQRRARKMGSIATNNKREVIAPETSPMLGVRRGRWTPDEDRELMALVDQYLAEQGHLVLLAPPPLPATLETEGEEDWSIQKVFYEVTALHNPDDPVERHARGLPAWFSGSLEEYERLVDATVANIPWNQLVLRMTPRPLTSTATGASAAAAASTEMEGGEDGGDDDYTGDQRQHQIGLRHPISTPTITTTAKGPLGHRLGIQAQARWAEALDPRVRRGPWSAVEDALLERAVQECSKCWIKISEWMPGRTQRQCRTRWVQLTVKAERIEAKRRVHEQIVKTRGLRQSQLHQHQGKKKHKK
ncbi:hypothetical protein DFQ26_001586 [Actinomortierella ambigua]|nr:hypothetical protein DFQ26_001586 [Actinomortierella ambigua]